MRRDRRDDDLHRELKAHLELDAEDRREDGATPHEARSAARRELGNVSSLRETVYEMGPFAWAGRWSADLRYAVRSLRRNPGFAAVAVLSLALGIGSATAIFSIADQALLRLLPVRDPASLRLLSWEGDFIGGSTRGWKTSFSYPLFRELTAEQPTELTGLAARFQVNATLDDSAGLSRGAVELVSGSYFETLGVGAALGRTLGPEDDQERDGEPWAVLGHELWRNRFGADPAVVGGTVRINGYPFTVIGVAQRGFKGFESLRPADVFVPLQMQAAVTPTFDHRDRRDSIWLNVFARLAPGVEAGRAEAALQIPYGGVLRRDLEAHARGEDKQQRYLGNKLLLGDAARGFGETREVLARPLHLLLAMVGLLLLITCVNVANLLVVRSAKREKEIAVRSSLGAPRGTVMRLVLLECLLLAAAGSALGLAVARAGAESLARIVPADRLGLVFQTSPDWRVLGFAVALALATALFFGLAPAIQAARGASAAALKDEAASVSIGRAHTRLRRSLVAVQVALSLVLLGVAGLFGKSLGKVFETNPGLDVHSLLAFFVNPAEHRYDGERARRFALDLQRRLLLAPGVTAASAAADPLLAGASGQNTIQAEGYEQQQGENMQAGANDVLPGFFAAAGVGLLAGRDFTERDALGGPKVVIVNETFANRFFGSTAAAIGRRVGSFLDQAPLPYEIVGVVQDHKSTDLREKPWPRTYFPLLQATNPGLMTFYVRAQGDPAALAGAARKAVQEVDSEMAVFGVKTLESQVGETHFLERLFARLSAGFAALATLIAVVGLYGVAAFSVARRTREIGVRMALGAGRGGIFRMVLGEAFGLALAGTLVGAPVALAAGKLMESQLYGVEAFDPAVLLEALAAMAVAAGLAAFFPARRATRISPVTALRHE